MYCVELSKTYSRNGDQTSLAEFQEKNFQCILERFESLNAISQTWRQRRAIEVSFLTERKQ